MGKQTPPRNYAFVTLRCRVLNVDSTILHVCRAPKRRRRRRAACEPKLFARGKKNNPAPLKWQLRPARSLSAASSRLIGASGAMAASPKKDGTPPLQSPAKSPAPIRASPRNHARAGEIYS